MSEYSHIVHTIEPVYNEASQILILGSLPSVKSREQQFFYGHKQNRFWKVLSSILDEPLPETIPQKKQMLLKHHIAVWDVIKSCDIKGSSDSSIRNIEPNDLQNILKHSDIHAVFTNGKTAGNLYRKYQEKQTGIIATDLPSTSPANAAYSLDRLKKIWGEALLGPLNQR